MTLLDLKDRTLSLLARDTTDDSIEPERVVASINRARVNGWRSLSGRNAAQTVEYDLTAGVGAYPLPTIFPTFNALIAVSIRTEAGAYPSPIPETTLPALMDRYPAFPEYDTEGDSVPAHWYVAPSATPTLVLWPPPSATVADGLVLQVAGRAAPLALDADVSALPGEVDEWACYRAAIDLTPFLREEPGLASWLSEIRYQEREAWRFAKRAVTGMGGGLRSLVPASETAFGDRSLSGAGVAGVMKGDAPLASGVYLTATDWSLATGGETGVTLDVTAHPVAAGHERGVVVKSAWRGEFTGIVNVTNDGKTITAGTGTNPDTGSAFTLSANEPYRAVYMEAV